MPEDIRTTMWDVVDDAVKQIALSRKVVEISDESVEDFDEELNKRCEKWHEHFKDMDLVDLSLWIIGDIEYIKEKYNGDEQERV